MVTMWWNRRRLQALDLHELHTALLLLEKAAVDHVRAVLEQHPTESDVRQLQGDVSAHLRRTKDDKIRQAAERAVRVCDLALAPGIREPTPEAFEKRETALRQIEEVMRVARDPILDRIGELTTRLMRGRPAKT